MFEDLRRASDEGEMVTETYADPLDEYTESGSEILVFGMTAGQRLILSLLLFGTVVVLGLGCLLVTERIWLY